MPISPEGNLEDYFVTEYWLIDQYIGDELLVWGDGSVGQLGKNSTSDGFTPATTFAGGTNWKQVACGGAHTAAIKTDGTLWTWGETSNGQLGANLGGALVRRSTPVTTFAGGTDWKQVACGVSHTAAIKTDGTLWVWGLNSSGQLGTNNFISTSIPVTTFAGGTNWKQVDGNSRHTAAIKTDGTLWTWGQGADGELGVNDLNSRSLPTTTFAGGTNWKQVSCGGYYTAAIKTDGTLWTWGRNTSGQLGDNTTSNKRTPVTTFAGGTNWKQVDGNSSHTAAIKTDGTLWTWGNNGSGKLGINDAITRTTPVTTFAGGTNWKQVTGGNSHTAAIKTDGTLWTWGYNGDGRLGNNSGNRSTPVTTFAGGTNWKQVASDGSNTAAVLAGTTPDLPIS